MVLSGSAYFGIVQAAGLKKRKSSLKSIERILMYLESEIRYKHSLISEALINASKKADKPFNNWLFFLSERVTSDIAVETDGFYEIWVSSLEMLRQDTCLSNEDIEELATVGQTLGYLDIEAHRAGLELEMKSLHEKICEYNEALTGKMRISVIAGALFGILVVIVLI